MKKTLTLTEQDIKSVMAEKFEVDVNDVNVSIYYENSDDYDPKVVITIESEVQNYDL